MPAFAILPRRYAINHRDSVATTRSTAKAYPVLYLMSTDPYLVSVLLSRRFYSLMVTYRNRKKKDARCILSFEVYDIVDIRKTWRCKNVDYIMVIEIYKFAKLLSK